MFIANYKWKLKLKEYFAKGINGLSFFVVPADINKRSIASKPDWNKKLKKQDITSPKGM